MIRLCRCRRHFRFLWGDGTGSGWMTKDSLQIIILGCWLFGFGWPI